MEPSISSKLNKHTIYNLKIEKSDTLLYFYCLKTFIDDE